MINFAYVGSWLDVLNPNEQVIVFIHQSHLAILDATPHLPYATDRKASTTLQETTLVATDEEPGINHPFLHRNLHRLHVGFAFDCGYIGLESGDTSLHQRKHVCDFAAVLHPVGRDTWKLS